MKCAPAPPQRSALYIVHLLNCTLNRIFRNTLSVTHNVQGKHKFAQMLKKLENVKVYEMSTEMH